MQFFLLVWLFLIVFSRPSVANDDWPMARHDARNTGRSTTTLPAALKLQWRVSVGDVGTLLASGGVVGVTHTTGVQLRDRNGKVVWQRNGAELAYLKDGQVVIVTRAASGGDNIQCVNWRKNTLIWTQSLGGTLAFQSASIVAGDTLYCCCILRDGAANGATRSLLKAFRMGDGTLRAERAVEISNESMASDGKSVYFGANHWLHILDAQTLEPQRAYYDGGTILPLLSPPFVVTQGWDISVNAINFEARQKLWRYQAGRGVAHCLASGPHGEILVVEALNVPTDKVGAAGVDIATGQVAWRHLMFVGGPAAAAGNVVYVPGWHEHLPGQKPRVSRYEPDPVIGGFYALDATGKLRWKYERADMRGVSIIAADGALFCLDEAGFLYKFSASRRRH